jgi:hypothetical protein
MPARVCTRLLVACSLALGAPLAGAQAPDANLQNLLSALTTGRETTLVTPLRSGMLQVTTFRPGTRLNVAEANMMVNQARDSLQALGEPQPTAEEIARMLAGGPIELPGGRIQTAGMLPSAGWPATIRSQIVAAGTPLPNTGAATSSAGGSAPASSNLLAAREMALQQLAALGIINPSEDQIRTALIGGTITTVNGVYELPGILTR